MIYLVIKKYTIVSFHLQLTFSFLKIRRTNLNHRTRDAASQRYTRASQTDEQREARNEVERNRWNRNQEHRNVHS